MEVHHHSHPSTSPGHRKKWTHYFWEFLMLFLAVFCGFLAENKREHFVEHQREKTLMASMVVDLRADTAEIARNSKFIRDMIAHIDSLIPLLSNADRMNANATKIYEHEVWISLFYKVIYTDRTIQQLKYSGNFRLIRHPNISDGLITYDAYIRNYVQLMQDTFIWQEWQKLNDAKSNIFKSSTFRKFMQKGYKNNIIEVPTPPYFLSTDKTDLTRYINQLETYAAANEWFLNNIRSAKKDATRLDSLIVAAYHLK